MLLQMVLLQIPSARTKYEVVAVGETVMLVPVAIAVPPQVEVYHLHTAEVPNVPPVMLNVVLLPLQIVDVPVIPVAGIDVSPLTVSVKERQMVVLQPPSALR